MRFKIGDQIRHPEFPHIIREIKEVHPTGYIWFYPTAPHPQRLFDSEDGTNPTFSEPWELVESSKKKPSFRYELPEGYRIEMKKEHYQGVPREVYYLFDPQGNQLIRHALTGFTTRMLDQNGDDGYQRTEKELRKLAHQFDKSQREISSGNNEGLKTATGFQKLQSLVGTTVTESSGILDSIFHEDNCFSITFSNGLCLYVEEFNDGTYSVTLNP